jgi:hypothetical protein
MPDNLNRRQPEDPNYINTHEEWEITYWCQALGISRERLLAVVGRVGNRVADVRRALGK